MVLVQKSADGLILYTHSSVHDPIEEFLFISFLWWTTKWCLAIKFKWLCWISLFTFNSNRTKCVRMEINKLEKNSNKHNWWIIICLNQNQHKLHVAIFDDNTYACVRNVLIFDNKCLVCNFIDYVILVGWMDKMVRLVGINVYTCQQTWALVDWFGFYTHQMWKT